MSSKLNLQQIPHVGSTGNIAQRQVFRPKEKVQKDKQRSTKHTHKTKDRVTGASEGLAVPALQVAPVVLI
jgi:hypothetical protein